MKRVVLLAVLILSAAAWFAGPSTGANAGGLQAPEEEIIIQGEKKSARFSHTVHQNLGVACGQCHHDSKHQSLTDKEIAAMGDGSQLRCAGCHNKDFGNPELQTIKDTFHARCKDCHTEGVAGKTGPNKCSDCHVK